MTVPDDLDRIAWRFAAIAVEAGRVIMAAYEHGCAVHLKADQSPVSQADEQAEAIIVSALQHEMPDLTVIAEEAVAKGQVSAPGSVFCLVDPLDGTREFVNRNGDFTVNIALIRDGIPVAGVILLPAMRRLYLAAGLAYRVELATDLSLQREKAYLIRTRKRPARDWIATVSRSHLDQDTQRFLSANPFGATFQAGSALKFGLIAEGEADVYPRFSPTCEWDVAAGHALVKAAGGSLFASDGAAMCYGRSQQGFIVPGFIVWGDEPIEAATRPKEP
jgi:3'(2'), 5'-bisphosphate nucleotidase